GIQPRCSFGADSGHVQSFRTFVAGFQRHGPGTELGAEIGKEPLKQRGPLLLQFARRAAGVRIKTEITAHDRDLRSQVSHNRSRSRRWHARTGWWCDESQTLWPTPA